MDAQTKEWLNLAFRWIHVFTAILWIGQTAFFAWLDARFAVGEENVWMVHSGGFYVVEKQRAFSLAPRVLHWFKWESLLTWLSGFFLLGIVYYMGGLLVEYGSGVSLGLASAVGLGSLLFGFVVYEAIWSSPLGRVPALGTALSVALSSAAAFGLAQVLSPRAAWIHVGAILGTIMTANVWMRILPAQRAMIEAIRAGREVDPALAARAKLRSKHNTFMAIPVTLVMIGNHFPTQTFGHDLQWLVLAGFLFVGFAARKLMNLHNEKRIEPPG
jgi:uncharacterized membrane protein